MELPGKSHRPVAAGRMLGLALALTLPLALALPLGLASLGCTESLPSAPSELLGTWKTDSAAHANHFLQVRSTNFVLGVAGLDLDVVPIERIERTRDEVKRTVYRLHFHADEGYDDVLVLTMLREAGGPALRIGAQPQVWRPSARR